jgi:hypothetical protein
MTSDQPEMQIIGEIVREGSVKECNCEIIVADR